MKITSKLILIFAFLTASLGAMAQAQLKVSTGGPTGTYSRMFKEFAGICKDQIMQIEVPSKGSIENIDRLTGNEVNAAIMQTDVLFHRARYEDLSNIKTLFAMHPEEVHVFTPVVSPITEGGTLGLGKKAISLNRVEELAGRAVAAWGGSVISAKVIGEEAGIKFHVVEVADFKAAKVALDAGQVAAVLMVGGQPMADIAALTTVYKLLPFSGETIVKLKSVYVPAKLAYSGMGQGGSGIQTVATEALFVTRSYKTAKYVESLSALRGCFKANLADLQETTGMHKKWNAVKAENTGKWAYYELPAASAPPVLAKKK